MQSTPVVESQFEVLVVGYGPVGAALAALLGRYGVKTLVVDRARDILLMPRAIALDNEALRILQMVGLTDDSFARRAIQTVKLHCPLLGEYGHINTAGSIDGHPKLVTFYQPELEAALRQQVEHKTSVTVRCGWALENLQQTSGGVSAVLKDEHGHVQQIEARYLVGADGASSTVRRLIGQDFEGKTYAQDWLIVDATRRDTAGIDHVEFLCDPQRPTPHMPAPAGRERWEFMLRPGECREVMERPETLAALLAPWGGLEQLTIERHAVYRFHARCCRRFQQGHVFLAGDAAHVMPPFVGQGLVAGLRDAANLAWKLAWVVRGQAHASILDTYNEERQPHARRMIGLAKFMGHLVMPANHVSAALVHGAVRALRWVPPLRGYLEELKIKPDNAFERGLFVRKGRAGVLRPGSSLGQALVKAGEQIRLSDDVLGDQFTLVGFGTDPCTHLDGATEARWRAAGGRCLQVGVRGQAPQCDTPFVEALGNDFLWRQPAGWLAVVRPDRVIMHEAAPGQANALVSQCLQLLA